MANHKSAKKRMRQDAKKRLHNRFYKKTARTAIAALRGLEDKKEAEKFLPKVSSMIDRLAKKNQIHKNKAANLKKQLSRAVKTSVEDKPAKTKTKKTTVKKSSKQIKKSSK